MAPLEAKEIYYLERTRGLSIIDNNNNIVGFHSGYAAVAHTSNSIGKIQVISNTPLNKSWISGKAVRIAGMGIKFVENYIVYDENNNPIPNLVIDASGCIIES